MKNAILILSGAILISGFQNCSPSDFKKEGTISSKPRTQVGEDSDLGYCKLTVPQYAAVTERLAQADKDSGLQCQYRGQYLGVSSITSVDFKLTANTNPSVSTSCGGLEPFEIRGDDSAMRVMGTTIMPVSAQSNSKKCVKQSLCDKLNLELQKPMSNLNCPYSIGTFQLNILRGLLLAPRDVRAASDTQPLQLANGQTVPVQTTEFEPANCTEDFTEEQMQTELLRISDTWAQNGCSTPGSLASVPSEGRGARTK
jgi:hypothetical protein